MTMFRNDFAVAAGCGAMVASLLLGRVAQAGPLTERAKPADALVESLGVGDQFDFLEEYGFLSQAFKAIRSLGIRYLRVGVAAQSIPTLQLIQAMKAELADGGTPGVRVRLSAQVGWIRWAETVGDIDAWLDAGSLYALEGVNEQWFNPDAGYNPDGGATAEEIQEAVWNRYADSGLEIYGWTLGGAAGNYLHHVDAGAKNAARTCHYLNMHPYHWYTTPGGSIDDRPTKMIGVWQNEQTPSEAGAVDDAGCIWAVHEMTKDFDASYLATEWGWSHDPVNGTHSVSMDVAAKFYARNVFEATNANLHRSFLFSLTQFGSGLKPDAGDPHEHGNYALANYADGSLFESGQAIANIVSILSEPGDATFDTDSLEYDLAIKSGMSYVDDHRIGDTEIHHALFERHSDRTFYLVLWVDYDSQNGYDAGTALLDGGPLWQQSATLTLPAGASDVEAYLPVTNAAPVHFGPVAPSGHISLEGLTAIPDHPLILAIHPATPADAQAPGDGSSDGALRADAKGLDAGAPLDATVTHDAGGLRNGSDAGSRASTLNSGSGCGCRAAGGDAGKWPWCLGLGVVPLVARRRRRRSERLARRP